MKLLTLALLFASQAALANSSTKCDENALRALGNNSPGTEIVIATRHLTLIDITKKISETARRVEQPGFFEISENLKATGALKALTDLQLQINEELKELSPCLEILTRKSHP